MRTIKKIALVAGEASGDILGASLIQHLKALFPDAQFEGIAGERMQAQGCASIAPIERLSVMGIVAILKRLLELLRLRKSLVKRWRKDPPDVFIGIDAPEFNLGLEEKLKASGIPTVHFVSPSVWAWRKKRIFKIKRAVDRMLTLFPFENDIYHQHEIPVTFTGHPLADQYPMLPDVNAARSSLGLALDITLVAVLPGSRGSELKYLSEPYIKGMQLLVQKNPDIHFAVPLVNAARRQQFERVLGALGGVKNLHLVDGQSQTVMTASNAVLLASGTASLEAMLLKKPMVVGYKVSGFSYFIFKRLLTISRFSLPNLLSDQELVPELIQSDCTPENIAREMNQMLCMSQDAHEKLQVRYRQIHEALRQNAGEKAALAVKELLEHAKL